ncbi:caspase family protein [Streptomyces sp. BE133]|uniref:caspase family protein n=1 Tax=Streptomyces sp. BE133 TaxID=3002523 RepID=UPI002E7746EA|nr:caspase family protein [Streptomyces sp. BE133]MEE1809686.1 caspase family protein [Streptomyces sp. BE133]
MDDEDESPLGERPQDPYPDNADIRPSASRAGEPKQESFTAKLVTTAAQLAGFVPDTEPPRPDDRLENAPVPVASPTTSDLYTAYRLTGWSLQRMAEAIREEAAHWRELGYAGAFPQVTRESVRQWLQHGASLPPLAPDLIALAFGQTCLPSDLGLQGEEPLPGTYGDSLRRQLRTADWNIFDLASELGTDTSLAYLWASGLLEPTVIQQQWISEEIGRSAATRRWALREQERPDEQSDRPYEPEFLTTWETGAAVLIGTSHYTKLKDVPAVENNLTALADLLNTGMGIPAERIRVVLNPESAANVHEAIDEARQMVDPATGGLLVYYAGHGWTEPRNGRLLLGLVGSDQRKQWSALGFTVIREQLADSQIASRIVILDACYSGAALDLLSGGPLTGSLAIEGSYVMTSSDSGNPSRAPKEDEYTSFTGEIIKVLREGIPKNIPTIDMDTLFRHVYGICEQRGWPLPDRQIRTDGGRLQLMRNRWGKR